MRKIRKKINRCKTNSFFIALLEFKTYEYNLLQFFQSLNPPLFYQEFYLFKTFFF